MIIFMLININYNLQFSNLKALIYYISQQRESSVLLGALLKKTLGELRVNTS